MNKDFEAILKLGAILQARNATKEEVEEAYKNSGLIASSASYESCGVNMKYKIEIWQYHIVAETYESDDIADILSWFRSEWLSAYDMGYCSFNVYEDGRLLDFDDAFAVGFYR